MDGFIYIGADHDVLYSGAVPRSGGSYLNTGSGTWTLKTAAGASVATGTIDYVAASNGNYTGVIAGTSITGLTEGTTYYVEISFADLTFHDFRRWPVEAAYRSEF